MKIGRKIGEAYKSINPISRKIITCGAVLTLVLYTLAVCALVLAGRGFDYYIMTALFSDLIGCIKPSLGVLLLGALLFEAVWTPAAE